MGGITMKEKDMYTLQELYNELEIPLSALSRKGGMSEGTVTRIRDGYPARFSTINKLLRAFSETYGIAFNRNNVTGIVLEDKKAPRVEEKALADTPSVKHTREPEQAPKRAYNRKQKDSLPDDCILCSDFAKRHSVSHRTFYDHMRIGLGQGVPWGMKDDTIPTKDHVNYSERVKPGREHEKERYLDQAQQRDAVQFWCRHGVRFNQCELLFCPCHQEGSEA
jgi:hypothetical protein